MQNISQEMLLDLLLPCPPLREQIQIVEFVEGNAGLLSELISKIGRAVERLKELRTALIFDAVTGKIDVRSA